MHIILSIDSHPFEKMKESLQPIGHFFLSLSICSFYSYDDKLNHHKYDDLDKEVHS